MLDTLIPMSEVVPEMIRRLTPGDAGRLADFVAARDEAVLMRRFHRSMAPSLVHAHYGALRWGSTTVLAWVSGRTICGIAEIFTFGAPDGTEAEIALCVDDGLSGRQMGQALLARAVAHAGRTGARRSVVSLSHADGVQARMATRLGAMLDEDGCQAVIWH